MIYHSTVWRKYF